MTYRLVVAVVDIVRRHHSLSSTHSVRADRAMVLRAIQVAEKSTMNQLTDAVRNIFLTQDLDEEIRKLISIVLAVVSDTRNRPIDDPRLSARRGNTTTSHALGFVGGDSAGDTTHRDVGREVVDGDERGKSPVGTRAEEPRTRLSAHGDDSSEIRILEDELGK